MKLCAKMRRAVLANTCVENGFGKLALGHHREDVIETLLRRLSHMISREYHASDVS